MKQPFIWIYDEWFDDLYRYVFSKVSNPWDTDDLVSDIFRKAFEKYETLQNDAYAKPWLFTIARHTVIDFYRKKKEALPGEAMERLSSPEAWDGGLEQHEEMECLHKAIAHLPEEERELVKLKYFAGLKHREIGEVLSKTEEVIKMRAYRLLKKLTVWVKACLEGGNGNG